MNQLDELEQAIFDSNLAIRRVLFGGPLCSGTCQIAEEAKLLLQDAMIAGERALDASLRAKELRSIKKFKTPRSPQGRSHTYMETSGRPIGRSGDTY